MPSARTAPSPLAADAQPRRPIMAYANGNGVTGGVVSMIAGTEAFGGLCDKRGEPAA